jgi:hypothetical protein
MGFREWLLKEDPNGVGLGSGDYDYCDYRDADAVPFIVYRGGHMRPGHDSSYTHVSMYVDATAGPGKRNAMIKVVGSPPSVPDLKLPAEREALMPHMVLGRLWTAAYCWSDDDGANNKGSRRRVVSFWSPPAQVMSLRGEILSMIRSLDMEDDYTPGEVKGGLDDPREYVYEVQGNIMAYDEFVGGGRKSAVSGWNPSKLHTMAPSPAKSFLMKGSGVYPSVRGLDLPTRMKSYTGD